jgi:hypothetical protein
MLPGTEGVLSEFYGSEVAKEVERARAEQEARANWVGADSKYPVVALRNTGCVVACVIDARFMFNEWAPSYFDAGYLGVFGEVEPSAPVKLVAPLHVWWQAEP